MHKKIIYLLSGCIIASSMFTGCGTTSKTDITALETQIKAVKDSNDTLEKRVGVLESEIAGLKLGDAKDNKSEIDTTIEEKMHTIYTADVDTYEKKTEMETYIPQSLTLDEKLNVLIKTLSEVQFGGLPIEVMSIEKIDGKKVATVNLKESKENQGVTKPEDFKGDTWIGKYFQGSAGGSITATTLKETLLQKEYKGEWIDGVKFLYNGAPIDFEHVGNLSEVIYR
ncbi:MAG: hypothetical protein AB9856_13555 [Cellulosilyticaceae bacterium]